MRDERFEVEDLLAAELHSELVQAGEAENFSFDVDVAAFCENLHETLENHIGWDSLRQQLIKPVTNLLKTLRRLFEEDLVSCFVEESLPVDFGDFLCLGEWIFLNFASFEHQNSAAKVSLGLVGDIRGEFDGKLQVLFLANVL